MKRMLKKFFQDDRGNCVVAQRPNLPLYTAVASLLLSRANFDKDAQRLFDLTMFCSIFVWAYLEITKGESPFRRVLGGLVMAGLLGRTTVKP